MSRIEDDDLWVDFPGNQAGPVRARRTLSLAELGVGASESRCEVLVVFPQGESQEPVVVGRLSPPEPETPSSVDLCLDGQRMVLRAEQELELRCGEARIVLRRNGRISVRGAYVETRAKGVNRIKGGSVQIN